MAQPGRGALAHPGAPAAAGTIAGMGIIQCLALAIINGASVTATTSVTAVPPHQMLARSRWTEPRPGAPLPAGVSPSCINPVNHAAQPDEDQARLPNGQSVMPPAHNAHQTITGWANRRGP
jgi:hypothetical protein